MTAYTSTYTIGGDPVWKVDDSTHIDGMPLFKCGDTVVINVAGAKNGVKAKLTFKKKGPPHESGLDTPFVQYNHKHKHSPYRYHVGDVLTFAENDKQSLKARWTFKLTLDTLPGGTGNVDNDPELQVGTGIGDGHK